jgi:hypothetical protein
VVLRCKDDGSPSCATFGLGASFESSPTPYQEKLLAMMSSFASASFYQVARDGREDSEKSGNCPRGGQLELDPSTRRPHPASEPC